MALESEKSYLHLLKGGFNNERRKKVRKLFAEVVEEKAVVKIAESKNLDLVVGVVEELHFIGIKEFNIEQVEETLAIFDLQIDRDELLIILNDARLRLNSYNGLWTVPDVPHLENMKRQFCKCDEEPLAARIAELKTTQLLS